MQMCGTPFPEMCLDGLIEDPASWTHDMHFFMLLAIDRRLVAYANGVVANLCAVSHQTHWVAAGAMDIPHRHELISGGNTCTVYPRQESWKAVHAKFNNT